MGHYVKVTKAQIDQTCNELDYVLWQKTRQIKEHIEHLQRGPQEHEPVMGFCTDHNRQMEKIHGGLLLSDVVKRTGGPTSKSKLHIQ